MSYFHEKVNSLTNAQTQNEIPYGNNFQLNGFNNSPLQLFINLYKLPISSLILVNKFGIANLWTDDVVLSKEVKRVLS